jgi:hypothetical protein
LPSLMDGNINIMLEKLSEADREKSLEKI